MILLVRDCQFILIGSGGAKGENESENSLCATIPVYSMLLILSIQNLSRSSAKESVISDIAQRPDVSSPIARDHLRMPSVTNAGIAIDP